MSVGGYFRNHFWALYVYYLIFLIAIPIGCEYFVDALHHAPFRWHDSVSWLSPLLVAVLAFPCALLLRAYYRRQDRKRAQQGNG